MMRVIRTRYHGPTDFKGARVSAKTPGGNRVCIPWDHALNNDGNHDAALRKLACKLGLVGKWYGASDPKGGRIYACPLGEPEVEIREQDIT